MAKLKILRLIQSFYPEVRGPINQAFYISLYLKQHGVESQINTTYYGVGSNLPHEELFDGIKVTRYQSRFDLMRYSFCPAIFSDLKNYDILHCHEARSFPVHVGWLLAKYFNKPIVVSAHGSIYAYKHLIYKWYYLLPYQLQEVFFLRKAMKMADRVIVSSFQEQEEAVEFGLDPKKVIIIPMGINVNRYKRKEKNKANKQLQLLYVSRISRHRYLEPVLHALTQVKDVNLIIVGNEVVISGTTKKGYLQELKELVDSLGISDKVTLKSACYGDELIDAYNKADVFVSTSKYESFGQPILEAAAAGLPIITTPRGVAKEIIKNDQTGYLVSEDPKEIRDRIEQLKDNKLRRQMSENIRSLIAQDFNWNKVALAYKDLYEELLG